MYIYIYILCIYIYMYIYIYIYMYMLKNCLHCLGLFPDLQDPIILQPKDLSIQKPSSMAPATSIAGY